MSLRTHKVIYIYMIEKWYGLIIYQFSKFTYFVIENTLFKVPCYYENIISNKRDVEEKIPLEIT